MRRLRSWLCRVVGMFTTARSERELARELESHLEMHVEDNIGRGMSREEARRVALVKLGGVEATKERYRDRRGIPALESLLQDVRYGARTLTKSPGFTLVAVLSLTLGVGANTAIFQLLDAVRLRPLPVPNPSEIVEVRPEDMKGASGRFSGWHPMMTHPQWEECRARQQALSGLVAWCGATFNLEARGEARNARGLFVSGEFFEAFGVRPALGRLLASADDRRGSEAPAAVISHAFWEREYGGVPDVLGRTITLDGHAFEIAGVAAEGFHGLEPGRSFDVAIPISADAVLQGEDTRLDNRAAWWLTVMGRLKPGWTTEEASDHLAAISPGLFEATLPPSHDRARATRYLESRLQAVPAGTGISELRADYEISLWLLLAIAALVLFIACVNLANLLLARASTKEREMAVRLALGASRARLVRQLLTESLLLAAVGALLGLVAAGFFSRALISFLDTQGSPLFVDLGLDWRVFGFTAGLAIATCALFGVAPALRATRTTPGAALKAGGRGSTEGRERFGFRRVLVSTQVALALVLLVGALLFARSLGNLVAQDTGFRHSGVLTASVDFSRLGLAPERRNGFTRDLVERIRAVPGVEGAADAMIVPLSGSAWNNEIWLDGSDPSQKTLCYFNSVGPGFFSTLATPLLAGRDVDERDTTGSPNVAIVNEEFARTLAGGANPVGMRFWVVAEAPQPARAYEIVGIAGDTKYRELREKQLPIAFLAASQDPDPVPYAQILLRSDRPAVEILPFVRSALASASVQLSFECEVFETQIQNTLVRERLMATLSSFFGVLAVILATVGLYGVTAYMVARRTHEIGIRVALGATRRDIAAMVMREVAILSAAGLAAGAVTAMAATNVMSSMLFGLGPHDPATLAAAAGILATVATAAGLVPAHRASSVDPMVALRDE